MRTLPFSGTRAASSAASAEAVGAASAARQASHSFADVLRRPRAPSFSRAEARRLLNDAWAKVVGARPDARTLDLLTAHWALETDGGRAMPGYNFAGIKALPGAAGAVYRTVEGHGANQRTVAARFRSYESAEAGAQDYVRLLHARYPAALEAARVGDLPAFAGELACGGYFTADPRVYAAGLASRMQTVTFGGSSSNPSGAALAEVALGSLLTRFRHSDDDA